MSSSLAPAWPRASFPTTGNADCDAYFATVHKIEDILSAADTRRLAVLTELALVIGQPRNADVETLANALPAWLAQLHVSAVHVVMPELADGSEPLRRALEAWNSSVFRVP